MTGGYYGAYGSTITGYYAEFPYPREVNCAGNYVIGTEQIEMFPYPLEATGGLTLIYFTIFYLTIGKFPYPHEVNGGSNLIGIMTITTLGFGFRSLSG